MEEQKNQDLPNFSKWAREVLKERYVPPGSKAKTGKRQKNGIREKEVTRNEQKTQ